MDETMRRCGRDGHIERLTRSAAWSSAACAPPARAVTRGAARPCSWRLSASAPLRSTSFSADARKASVRPLHTCVRWAADWVPPGAAWQANGPHDRMFGRGPLACPRMMTGDRGRLAPAAGSGGKIVRKGGVDK
jgi:hypothetical protein